MVSKVQVWVKSPDSWLLLKTLPARGKFWQPVTGSVDPGESVLAAALRELHEETGLRSVHTVYFTGLVFEFKSRWGKRVREFVFVASVPTEQSTISLDTREHDAFDWCDTQSVLNRMPNDYRPTESAFAKIESLAASIAI